MSLIFSFILPMMVHKTYYDWFTSFVLLHWKSVMRSCWFVRMRCVFFQAKWEIHMNWKVINNWWLSQMYDSLGILPPNHALPGTAGCIPSAGGTSEIPSPALYVGNAHWPGPLSHSSPNHPLCSSKLMMQAAVHWALDKKYHMHITYHTHYI